MPNRIIRERILDSERVDKLSAAGEVFYRRLMNVVDDFGRFDARPPILIAALYPLRVGKVTEQNILSWLKECEDADLILTYKVNNKPYLEFFNLQDKRRAQTSKYPPAPADACNHVRADARRCAQMSLDSDSDSDSEEIPCAGAPGISTPPSGAAHPPPSEANSGKPSRKGTNGHAGALPGFDRFWQAWPSHQRKSDRAATKRKWIELALEPFAGEIVVKVEAWKKSRSWTKDGGEYIPAPEVWLNKRRFEAEVPPAGELQDGAWGPPPEITPRMAEQIFAPQSKKDGSQ